MMDQLGRSQGPTFMFGITMQNHGSYKPNRYDHADVRVESKVLSAKELGDLQSYTQGIYETDQMLGRLTEFLKQRKRPAIVIYFGDHLPAISTNFEVQAQTGFVQGDSTAADRLKLHATPALIWANYPANLHFDEKIISAGADLA